MPDAKLTHSLLAGGAFAALHDKLHGGLADAPPLELQSFPPEVIQRAQATWLERLGTEYRSIQIMTRFLSDLLDAGEPLDILAMAQDMMLDEIRHTHSCALVAHALGAALRLPNPTELKQPEAFLKMPPKQRALCTAIAMLAVNETVSVAFIRDLAERCTTPFISQVLHDTCADEDTHEKLGWEYVERTLATFPIGALSGFKQVVQTAVAPQRRQAEATLAAMDPDRRKLSDWPDAGLIDLGLFSPQRQALVYQEVATATLIPRLSRLGLW